jgi:MoxR-like ATPase
VAEFFDKLHVFGYSRDDEAVVLASLLTGEPTLLIGAPGAAKTLLIRKLGKALGVPTAIYNAAFAQFEDMIGFLDMKKMAEGMVDYISTPTSIWGKTLVGVDEVNRPTENNANKWLDYLGEGTMLGRHTGVKWRLGAMNPYGTMGTNQLGEATIGRFASFVFAPIMVDMSTGEQEAVVREVADTNLMALTHWSPSAAKAIDTTDYNTAGRVLRQILEQAADHFAHLAEALPMIDRFLVRFASSIAQATAGKEDQIRIDGRRAGFLRRLILAVRAVEIARANILHLNPKPLHECVRVAIRAGLPVGVNAEGGRTQESMAKLESTLGALMGYLGESKDVQTLEIQYELLTTTNPFRKAEILLKFRDRLDRVIQSAGWRRITESRGFNASLVAFVATQVEMTKPGTVPSDVLDGLTKLMNSGEIVPRSFPIPPHLQEYEKDLAFLLEQKTELEKLVAAHQVAEFAGRHADIKGRGNDNALKTEIDDLKVKVLQEVKRCHNLAKEVDKFLEAA